jgi:DHA1 family inner membrane transport protein
MTDDDLSLIVPQAALRSSRLKRLLTIAMLGRLAHDLSIRLVYPYIPELAAGLRISESQVGVLVFLRNAVGVVGPIMGALSDRTGHRRAMIAGLLLVSLGLALIGLSEGLVVPGLGFLVAGIGSAVYIPTLIAYTSERVPYHRRGRILGAIELSWALAGMIGVPIAGVLIASLGWRAPFIGLAVAALTCAGLTTRLEEAPRVLRRRLPTFNFRAIGHNRSAMAFIIAWFLVFFAFENIQISYGSWLKATFAMDVSERGWAQTLFGIFEITASGSSSFFLDRLGKKRGVTGGLLVALLGYVMLISLGQTALSWALASISVAFLGFEFSVVSGVSIMSEQVPEARGTMLAMGVTAGSLGRMVADPLGSALTASSGFTRVAMISIGVAVASVLIFVLGVRDRTAE